MKRDRKEQLSYHVMVLPATVLILIFSIIPILGIQLAFKKFNPMLGIWGSPWVGLDNFIYVFQNPHFMNSLRNTVVLASAKIIFNLFIPIIFALLLNEVRLKIFKRSIQTIVYLPYFLSWVILAGMFRDMLSLDGVVNKVVGLFHSSSPIMFLGDNVWFPIIIVVTDVWQHYGFDTIIYLAALTIISPSLFEAAEMDGASRWKQLVNITLPSIIPTIVLLSILSLQNILNAGFDQIFNLYNPMVYSSGDILDTYVFRLGLQQAQYEVATAVGLFKSVISFILIIIATKLASKFADYRIF